MIQISKCIRLGLTRLNYDIMIPEMYAWREYLKHKGSVI